MEPDDARQPETVNVTELIPEDHVRESFLVAGELANGQPINAGLALQAAVIVNRTRRSDAFQRLAAMLPSLNAPRPSNTEGRQDLTALRFSPPFLAAYLVAKSLGTREGFWGRDYITMALLAADASLKRIADAEDVSLDDCRDEWFDFVTSDEGHRSADEWERWWSEACVPLPKERTVPSTGRTCLLTWNPRLTPFSRIKTVAERVMNEGTAIMNWNAGHEGLSPGDRVFFMRHGEERPGLSRSAKVF